MRTNTFTKRSYASDIFYIVKALLIIIMVLPMAGMAQIGQGTVPVVTPAGGFRIEGDLVSNSPVAGIGDWVPGAAGSGGSVLDAAGNPINPGTTFHLTDNYASNDNSFGGGAKFNQDPNTWTWSNGSANNKTDMNNCLIHFSRSADGHQWVIVAADRLSSSGTAYLDFEFLQNTLTDNPNGTFTSAGPNGGRTAGDFALTLSISGGGANSTFNFTRWQITSGTTYDYVDRTASTPAGSVYASVNAGTIPVSFGAFGGTSYTPGTFVEGAVDLTAVLGAVDPCSELGIKTILVKTKTSTSSSASIMDFISAKQVKLQLGVAEAGPAQAKCSQGASTTFTLAGQAAATPGDTVKTTTWSIASGSATIANPSSLNTTVQVTSATATLRLTITTKNGCTAKDSLVLTVNPAPTASISGASSICSNDPVTLTASTNATGPTYLWSPGGATTSSITVPPSLSTTYSVTITNSSGCSTVSAGHLVTVNPKPVVSINPLTLCEGTSGDICATSTGSNLTYTWSNGIDVQCFTVTVPNTYSVVVTDGNTCSGTASVTVPLVQPPNLKVTPSGPTTFCMGDSVTLTASGATNYSWSTGATVTTIKVKADGLYTVTGSNAIGCDISVLTYVTVNPSPVVSITAGGNTTFCQGGSVSLTANGAGTYLWSNNLTGVIINVNTSGNYSVVGTDGNGCKGSATKLVTVNPLPNVTFTSPGSVCHSAVAFTLTGGSPAGGIYSGSGVSGGMFNPSTLAAAGVYPVTYTYTNGNGCTNSAVASITVVDISPAPATISGPVQGVCALTSKNYSVASVPGATSYTWTAPANAVISSGQGTNSVTVAYNASFISGILSVKANSNCGSSSATAAIISSVPNTPANIFGNTSPCKRGTYTYWVDPVPGATSYTWSVPSGSSITSGQGTTSVTVSTGNKSGYVTVLASNACGTNGAVAVTNINVSCRTADPSADMTSSSDDLTMTVYPNPAHDLLNVSFNSTNDDNYSIKIYDITGRLVMEKTKRAEAGDNLIELNMAFAKGIYLVTLTSGDLSKQAKILVE